MEWKAKTNGELQRMIALLVSFARLAERAGAASFPVRFLVLAILRHAEVIAWAFAEKAASGPAVCRARRLPRCFAPIALVPVDDGGAEAVRLAVSFRTLALIVAGWAARLASAGPPIVRCSGFPKRARPERSREHAAALPAPDTS